MTVSFRCSTRLITIAAVISILSTFARSANYVQTEAMLTGNEIHAFQDAGQNVAVVLGDFRLELIGERTIVARDGVVWINSHPSGPTERHDITVYAEGGATLIDSDGTERSAEKIVVTFHSEGRFSAEGLLTDRPLVNFPLYLRAKEARSAPRRELTSPRLEVRKPDVPATDEIVVGESDSNAPADAADEPVFIQPTGTDDSDVTPKPVEPKVELIPQHVEFSADDDVSTEMTDTGRITIIKGNVYVSIGGPQSAEFIELRSDAAVIFSQPGAKKQADIRFPMSTDLEGFGKQNESVTGVYLEGDVVISRGERFFRAPAAYYDLVKDRAIILEPVFRTVQEQRNIPVYIRAREARVLSAREMWFADAHVTTSDFYTPSYAMASRTAYIEDQTPYDELGKKIGEQKWHAKMKHATFRIRNVPVFYLPRTQGSLEQGNTSLRKVSMGKNGDFGWGVQTQWHLFRMLGLVKPTGFKGVINFDIQEYGVSHGIDMEYARDTFSGYHKAYLAQNNRKDDFGSERENIETPDVRGRLLMRHKQILPRDWQLQFELSYVCDRNFMEKYFPDEFFAGKEQETLLYAKKQKDNWAVTSLMQYRVNRFLTQTESYPDLELFLLGEPLLGDRLVFFHESRVGAKRFRPANWTKIDDSDTFGRFDIRDELQIPLKLGDARITPYVTGRATYWTDEPDWLAMFGVDGQRENSRPYGQVGVRATTDIWRVFPNVQSRLWDVHGIKHVITPQATGFVASSHGVYPYELFPMDHDVEGIERTSGGVFSVYQRLQTKRGIGADRRTVDWMRLNLSAGFYNNQADHTPSVGRFSTYRPENSVDRNHINTEYFWNISDATALIAKANYDIEDERLAKGNIGFAVQRSPRLSYLAGCRYIDDADSAVGTFGVNYQINKKYSISAFEQYDFAFRNGRNISSTVAVTRKWSRWYSAFVFSYDSGQNEATMLINFWPEGLPEVSLGGAKLGLLGSSSDN